MMNFFTLLDDRSVLQVSGPEALPFLQGLVSADLETLTPDRAVFTTLLTPQGKILFEFFIIPAEEGYLLDCDKETAASLLKRLKLYKLRADVTLTDIADSMAVAAIFSAGDNSPSLPDMPTHALAFEDPRLRQLGYRLYAPQEDLQSYGDLLEAPTQDYAAHCIMYGVPALGGSFKQEEMFLLDVNYDLLNAVSYQKGCFVGQEVTSRMKRKGEVRKRTLIATGDGIQFEQGTDILAGDAKIGTVLNTSNNTSLALIRMDRLTSAETPTLTCNTYTISLAEPPYFSGS